MRSSLGRWKGKLSTEGMLTHGLRTSALFAQILSRRCSLRSDLLPRESSVFPQCHNTFYPARLSARLCGDAVSYSSAKACALPDCNAMRTVGLRPTEAITHDMRLVSFGSVPHMENHQCMLRLSDGKQNKFSLRGDANLWAADFSVVRAGPVRTTLLEI